MTDKQSSAPQSAKAHQIADKVTSLSVTSCNAAFEDGSEESADSTLSLPQETASIQSPPAQPLWKSREGRIAGYRRMIEKNHIPDHRANLEALIRYYEEGGKVPEGDEEVWAVEEEVSFGIRDYRGDNEMPEGWMCKLRYCDVSESCLC